MKKIGLSLLLLLFLLPALPSRAGASAEHGRPAGKGAPFVRGHIIVKFREGTQEQDRHRALGLVSGRKGRKLRRVGIEKVYLPPGWDEERAAGILERNPAVEFAGVDGKVELLGAGVLLGRMATLVPGDTHFLEQWHLDSTPFPGYFTTSSNPIAVDVDIDAPEAWEVMDRFFEPSMSAAVGVIDSGCGENGTFDTTTGYDPGHLDLPNGILFINPEELPADGQDSSLDGNSLVDDANGWDFVEADNAPADTDTSLSPYHGTLISGIIGAAWDNGEGVAGIGKGQLQVLPLRFIESFFDVVAAVEYAMDLAEDGHAVRVLNMSFKSTFGDPSGLRDAVGLAQSYGIAVVAAAGNDNGNNNDDYINRVFPAEYTRDPAISNVLAVAATGRSGSLAGFSNIGPGSVQIAAPGVEIYSTYSGSDTYGLADGTSFSTPIAGAVLGLVMAAHPTMGPAEAIDRVVQGGDFDARLAGLIASGRRVNLAGALAPFFPYSGLAYLDSTVPVNLYTDSISVSYGTLIGAQLDPASSTSGQAAVMTSDLTGAWAVSAMQPGIAQFTLTFAGASAPVGTYDTGPWRVTAIRPFRAQVRVGATATFTPLLAGDISWAVTDTSVATIDDGGVLTGLAEGMTRVILSEGGVERDYSGWVLVTSASAYSKGNSGGGCGTASSPGGNPWTGAAEMAVVGLILLILRRRALVVRGKKFRVQGSE